MAKTDKLIVYGNMSQSCDLQINALSSSQVAISIIPGNMTGLDYMYVERLGSVNGCTDGFVAFIGPLGPCTTYIANDMIQLHFRGNFALGIHAVMKEQIILLLVMMIITMRIVLML